MFTVIFGRPGCDPDAFVFALKQLEALKDEQFFCEERHWLSAVAEKQ